MVGPNKMMQNLMDCFEGLNYRYGESKGMRLRNGSEMKLDCSTLDDIVYVRTCFVQMNERSGSSRRVCPW